MRDAITGLIGRYDQLGRYLDGSAIDRIATRSAIRRTTIHRRAARSLLPRRA